MLDWPRGLGKGHLADTTWLPTDQMSYGVRCQNGGELPQEGPICGRRPYNGDSFDSHLLVCSFQGLSKDNPAGGSIEWPQYHGL